MKPKNVCNYVARKELNDRSNRPVVVVSKSKNPPTFKGRGSGWETKTGIEIHYPTAYSKVGWSSMIYRPSTLHIEVGIDWCIKKVLRSYPQMIKQMNDELGV